MLCEGAVILVVDDHPDVRLLVRLMVQSHFPQAFVREVPSGEEAVVQAGQLDPVLVLMDINLPGVGGFEATRQLLAVSTNTQVVILSSHLEAICGEAARRAGAAAYVCKSDVHQELIPTLERVLGKTDNRTWRRGHDAATDTRLTDRG